MAQIKHTWSTSIRTFDYCSFRIESNVTFDVERDLDAIKLIGERLDINPIDEDGVVDMFKVDRIIREYVKFSFDRSKQMANKLPKETFGLAQFEGENWVAT